MTNAIRKFNNLRIILFFTVLTIVLTWLVIFTYEHFLRQPFYGWVEARFSGDKTLQDQIEQRVEHFFISTTVDVIIVTLLLRLIHAQQGRLRDSEERYRSLFEQSSDGIGVIAAADHHIIETNKKFSDILGHPQLSLHGKHVCDLFRREGDTSAHPLLVDVFACDSPEALHQPNAETLEAELTIRTARGAPLVVSASCRHLATGKEKLYILILRDLSERKRLERERQEMQRRLFQASKLAALGELSAGVAHEINNPLSCIINFAELLKDDERPRNDMEAQMISGIIDEGSRIAEIVRNLLTFARPDSPVPVLVSVGEVVDNSIAMFGHQLAKDGIDVRIEIAGDLPPVRAAASRLRQVVINMISNAHHALQAKADSDKRFVIRAYHEQQAGGPVVRLEFFDNGPGISRQHIDKVFDPFFTTRRDSGGTGLGLSLSFGIIRDFGGKILVDSEEGVYTRFIVELPAQDKESPEYAQSSAGG